MGKCVAALQSLDNETPAECHFCSTI